ncbi:lactonase family protein [Devosia sp. ZB163]|uniref:lactonase family protein n=1 Tax=Devosia sp. ZB163 TaxID=3025938 RepID=UPI00236124C5|nr:lactonase family protein [Devosia sp. ZB163]MDC9825298.1 lactonase family protein [Devosia sp. ZB163]
MPIYAFTGSLTRPMPQYGAANGQGIGRLVFNDDTGELRLADFTGGVDDTAWLVTDPARGRLYSTCEITGTNQSAIAAYAVEAEGLRLIGRQPTLGNEACHASLSRDGRFLLVANYNGANPEGYPDAALTVFPIGTDGSLGDPIASVRHTGSGPNRDRQLSAHAHCVVSSPAGDVVYVADLGIDKLVAYDFGNDGSLTRAPDKDFAFPPGLGPRHLVFHPDGSALFVVSELIATVVSLAVDPTTGALSQRDAFRIPSLDGGIVQSAGILLAPDNRHLFVSLRVCDEILVLRIEADGRLTRTARVKSGGNTPRDLAFSPSGKHLVVANQDSDRLTVFRVDHASGTLSEPIQHLEIGTPMSVKLAAF